jgi:hypothetical protein
LQAVNPARAERRREGDCAPVRSLLVCVLFEPHIRLRAATTPMRSARPFGRFAK